MKLKRLLRNFVCAAALGSLAAGTVACSDDDSNGAGDTGKTGTLSGAVTDNFGQPLAGSDRPRGEDRTLHTNRR